MEKENQIQTFFEIEKSTVRKKMSELSFHPLSEKIYSMNEEFIDLLAQNIRINGLFNRIVTNTKGQILAGNQRIFALEKIGIEEIDVDQIVLDEEKELEYIISSNQQRTKTFIDKRNEIRYLFDKYTPGQGKNAGGSNTIKQISVITGYSTGEISSIRKIDRVHPDFLSGIDEGRISLNGASRYCDFILKLQVMGTKLQKDFISNTDPYDAESTFNKTIVQYCSENSPKYLKMVENGEMSHSAAYEQLFTDKITENTPPRDSSASTGKVKTDCNCPVCHAAVRDKEFGQFINRFRTELENKIMELKSMA
ncbi:MAG: hypothetical protein JXI43_04670 [Tissierellales bacterium]|nr:hypothetical protein [Tissierellales bacterium]